MLSQLPHSVKFLYTKGIAHQIQSIVEMFPNWDSRWILQDTFWVFLPDIQIKSSIPSNLQLKSLTSIKRILSRPPTAAGKIYHPVPGLILISQYCSRLELRRHLCPIYPSSRGFETMKTRRLVCWCAVFAFWGSGGLILWRIWNFQKSLPDPLGSYIEFTIMFLATFYVLALFPVKRCVDRFCFPIGTPVANNEGS